MDTTEHIFGLPQPGVATSETADSSGPGASVASIHRDDPRAAAQLLEMTAREIDRWRSEAEDEAAKIVAAGREEAAELVRAARGEAERLLSSARGQAAIMKDEARAAAARMDEEMATTRRRHDSEVARLEEIEAQHRHGLRRHLTEMLDQVDAADAEGLAPPTADR